MKNRVERNTSQKINEKIERKLQESIRYYKGRPAAEISSRIDELDREWDIERMLEVNMSSLALTGLGLGVFHHRRWLILPALVLGFFAQHAIQGWCPPLPLFRKLGYRTRSEIDREKYALKLIRGDFNGLVPAAEKSTEKIRQAVSS